MYNIHNKMDTRPHSHAIVHCIVCMCVCGGVCVFACARVHGWCVYNVYTSHLSMHHGDLWLHVDHFLLKLFVLRFCMRQSLFVLFATNSNKAYNGGNHHNHYKYGRHCSSKYYICSSWIAQNTNIHCQCSSNVNLMIGKSEIRTDKFTQRES